MNYSLHNGEIRLEGLFYEEARYDVSNSLLMAGFDGRGNIIHYSRAGIGAVLRAGSFYSGFIINGVKFPSSEHKQISMIGRRQSIDLAGLASMDQVIDQDHDCVVFRFRLPAGTRDFSWVFGYILDASRPQMHVYHDGGSLRLRETEGCGYHWSFDYDSRQSQGVEDSSTLWVAFGSGPEPDCKTIFNSCSAYEQELRSYLHTDNEIHRALFVSALNAGISAWKRCPGCGSSDTFVEGSFFEGFFAGIDYQTPARTYYRDAYWTVQPLLRIRTAWVRSEIITLACGIDEDLDCPSGVQSDGQAFWPKHVDSPLFFILMVADYVEASGDTGVLETEVKGRTVGAWMHALIERSAEKADHHGLLVRGHRNRHDWADNVFRSGYVSYVEILWWRALDRMQLLFPHAGYGARAETVCTSINDILWDEELGQYINYADDKHQEKNLSLDTVTALLWGLVPPGREDRFIETLALQLETRSNASQPFGDWGVMCLWPPYAYAEDLVEKSMYDFTYHNASEWPWLSALYALALKTHGRDFEYPLTRWFIHGLGQGWYTPVEYHSPVCGRGSLLQAWSSLAAAAFI